MSLRPSTYVRLAARAARRRRYGYAALRVLRRGLGRAMAQHFERSVGRLSYASELHSIETVYWRALRELQRRFPTLKLDDERARP